MINVVLTLFNRVDYLKEQLESLILQTVANEIHLHIISNNPNANFKPVIDGCNDKLKITFEQRKNDLIFFERHKYALKQKFEYTIFLDDDIILQPHMIETLWNMRTRDAFVTFFGRIWENINDLNKYRVNAPYNGNLLYNGEIPKSIPKYFNYGGAGFSIIHKNILIETFKKLEEFKHIKNKILLIDDIFISWVCNINNFKIINSKMHIDMNRSCDKHASYLSIMDLKNELVEFLHSIQKWKK